MKNTELKHGLKQTQYQSPEQMEPLEAQDNELSPLVKWLCIGGMALLIIGAACFWWFMSNELEKVLAQKDGVPYYGLFDERNEYVGIGSFNLQFEGTDTVDTYEEYVHHVSTLYYACDMEGIPRMHCRQAYWQHWKHVTDYNRNRYDACMLLFGKGAWQVEDEFLRESYQRDYRCDLGFDPAL